MAGFSIGFNALRVAAQLMKLAGDNIANAGTEGYHARRASVLTLPGPTVGGLRIGEGSTVEDVRRIRDELIERGLLTSSQLHARLEEEVRMLDHLELLFTEPSGVGLDARLGEFFDSVAELAGDPSNVVLREQVVHKAQSVCDTFVRLDGQLRTIADNLYTSAELLVGRVNSLTEGIADLNKQIRYVEATGVSAPGLKDNRDRLIGELAELVNVTTHPVEHGVVNVSCSGALLVSGGERSAIQLSQTDEGLVVSMVGAIGHVMDVREGRLAAILNGANNLLPEYRSAVDELANAFRRSFNLIHTTALGLGGRFHYLEGLNDLGVDTPLCDLGYGVPAGTNERLMINVEDEATGEVTQHELVLDTTQPAVAFQISLRDAINTGVDHVTASLDEGKIILQAEDGYAFGFATPYDPNPAAVGDITPADPTAPLILDAYTGSTDLAYEFSFLDGGEIGTDDIAIQITVREPGGPVLRTFTRQIGADYGAGDAIALENGLKFALSAGNVAAGDGFSVVARHSMDTAGVLDALGLNTFFTGLGAAEIQVAQRIYEEPENLSAALREMAGDNHRLLDMAQLRSARMLDSGSATMHEYYRALLSEIATIRNTRSMQQESQEHLLTDLQDRRDSLSGVNIDEEMVRLLQSRTIYQGALKFIAATDQMLSDLVELL